jgi:phage shock protein A
MEHRGLACLGVASFVLVESREPVTMEIVMSDDLTLKVLIEIRDGIAATNARVDQTNQRIDKLRTDVDHLRADTNQRLDQLRTEHLESEVRQATRMTELIASTRSLNDMLSDRFDLRDRVERCESEIAELKKRVG